MSTPMTDKPRKGAAPKTDASLVVVEEKKKPVRLPSLTARALSAVYNDDSEEVKKRVEVDYGVDLVGVMLSMISDPDFSDVVRAKLASELMSYAYPKRMGRPPALAASEVTRVEDFLDSLD